MAVNNIGEKVSASLVRPFWILNFVLLGTVVIVALNVGLASGTGYLAGLIEGIQASWAR